MVGSIIDQIVILFIGLTHLSVSDVDDWEKISYFKHEWMKFVLDKMKEFIYPGTIRWDQYNLL